METSMNDGQAQYVEFRPTLLQRIFPYGRMPDAYYDQPEWAKDCLHTDTVVRLNLWGRILLLVSGRMKIRTATYSDSAIAKCETYSTSHVMYPGEGL